ncbi:GNAT family N-acetyltransferase [Candidatus Woesearchaeota archaeon]|nr:GNAT family N-acetyltransferase [Candidatus Woesearchaeota archaeon]
MISVRKAALKDIPSIAGLWCEFMKEHDKIVLVRNKKLSRYTPRKKNAENNYRSFIKKQLKSGNGAIFLAEAEDTAAGYVFVIIKDEIPVFKLKKIGYISDLYVKKALRGMKISSKLKDEAMKWLKKKGLKHISIGLYVDNEFAHSVYKKWGFFDYKLEMRRKIDKVVLKKKAKKLSLRKWKGYLGTFDTDKLMEELR